MVSLDIVSALFGFFFFDQTPGESRELLIRLAACARQHLEVALDAPRVQFGEIEMRLLVSERASAGDRVFQHYRLDPGLPGPERGDRTEIEDLAAAFPAIEQRIGGFRDLLTLGGGPSSEIVPRKASRRGPGESRVRGQVVT